MSFNFDINDFYILEWLIKLIRFDIFNRMYDFQTSQDTAKYSMFVIKPWRRSRRDKELRSIRVWSSIRHAKRVRPARE